MRAQHPVLTVGPKPELIGISAHKRSIWIQLTTAEFMLKDTDKLQMVSIYLDIYIYVYVYVLSRDDTDDKCW